MSTQKGTVWYLISNLVDIPFKCIRNEFHHALYRWNILEDDSFANPGISPYFSTEVFSIIKHVRDSGTLNIITMSTSQWYKVLLERYVTTETDNAGLCNFIQTRREKALPDIQWERSFGFLIVRGLTGEQTSLIFKLLHNLLPVRSRLYRMNLSPDPICELCL